MLWRTLRKLKSENGSTREKGIKTLVNMRAVDALISALNHTDNNVRSGAAEALGRIGDTSAVEPLLARLEDRGWVKVKVIEALGIIGDRRAVEPLITILSDEEGAAVEALGKIGDVEAVVPIVNVLRSENEYARKKAKAALVKFGDASIEPLIELLSDENWSARKLAAEILGEIGDERAIDPLINILRNDKARPYEVAFAARSLIRFANERADVREAVDQFKQREEACAAEYEARRKAEQIEKQKKGGSNNCSQCQDGLQWWSRKTLSGAGISINTFGRPQYFRGACKTCRDGFCTQHAPEDRCPTCGGFLVT